MLLFIDFRKAFDLVDSDLLMLKLFHYGFSNSALDILRDYFIERYQLVKTDNVRSALNKLKLGLAQGSNLGPLFFIIYINDLPFDLKILNVKCLPMIRHCTTPTPI